MRLKASSLVLVTMVSCKACDEEDVPVRLVALDGEAPVALEVGSAVGPLSVTVPVILVNAWGTPVPGGPVEVGVAGATTDTTGGTLTVDAWGYADLVVHTTTAEAFTVTPVSSQDGATPGAAATSWSVAGPLVSTGLMPGWSLEGLEEPTSVVAVTGGVLLAGPDTIWFQGFTTGALPVRVLSTEVGILGVAPAQIDGDGVMDVVVHTAREVILLRGRPDGGMSWGAGFTPAGDEEIKAVSPGDVNGDQIADLAVVLSGGMDNLVVLLAGDGAWSFAQDSEFAFGTPPTDVLLASSDNDGYDEVNLLDGDAVLVRYARRDEGWLETGPSRLESGLTAPASFLGGADLNGQGSDDIAMLGAVDTDGTQKLVFYTTDGSTTQYTETLDGMSGTLADLTGDGLQDVLLLSSGTLWFLTRHDDGENDTSTFIKRNVSFFPEGGLLAVGEYTGGDLADVVVSAAGLRLYPGQVGNGAGQWQPIEVDWTPFALELAGEPQILDRDGDGLLDALVSLTVGDTGVWHLKSWRLEDQEGARPTIDNVTDLSLEYTQPGAMARCGDTFFLLSEANGATQLTRYDLGEDGALTAGPEVAVSADLVTCGTFAGGGLVAVADATGAVTVLDGGLVGVGTASVAEPEALAAADPDGDGVDEVVACDKTGCDVLAADLDGTPGDEVYTAEQGSLFVDVAGEITRFAGGGVLSLADVDGDGRTDLLAAEDGVLRAWRSLPSGLVPAEVQHTREPVVGAPVVSDFDGDGVPEVVMHDDGGYLLVARSWE